MPWLSMVYDDQDKDSDESIPVFDSIAVFVQGEDLRVPLSLLSKQHLLSMHHRSEEQYMSATNATSDLTRGQPEYSVRFATSQSEEGRSMDDVRNKRVQITHDELQWQVATE